MNAANNEIDDYETMSKTTMRIFLLRNMLKHGGSLYLKFEGLNLSIIIIFKTFHWLKSDESCSSSAWLVVAASLAKSDFMLL